jgi:exopolyphosphatase/guanosine-5'-triphosphate,3'-diphosphate pyrophosphatase
MSQAPVFAVIDVGSNSVRLLVARELTGAAFEVMDEERFDARIGEGQESGVLSDAGIERGLRALSIMAEVARSYAPAHIVAVGTEALRRAPNAATFIAEARRRTGLTVRVLSGYEEARAGYLGVINSTTLRNGYLLDIGGGSLELMRVEDRKLAAVTSAPLGAIYATERYFRTDPPSRRDVRALRKAVRQQFKVNEPLPDLYGAGGSVRNLARMVRARRQYPLRRLHGFAMGRPEISRLTRSLVTASADDRRKLAGISQNRIDILPAAAVVIDEVMNITGATQLIVSGQGLREGVLWEELRGGGSILDDVRSASIAGLVSANGADPEEGERTARTAAILFQSATSLHGLDNGDQELLEFAARLSNLGMHVEFYNRDRHAEYLIHSGDLHGFSHREIVMLAAIVRCSTSGTPDLTPYARVVTVDDWKRAATLAAVLGAARAIHRRHPTSVTNVGAELTGGELHLTLCGSDGLQPELHAFGGQQRRLESVLKVAVSVHVNP